MSLVDNIINQQSFTYSENGALALNNTGSDLVNLFANCGALRSRNVEDIEQLFIRALIEDKLLATKIAFYTRDIRGGLGERRTGRIMFAYLAKHYPEIMKKNLHLISEYGRYDDLIYLLDYLPNEVCQLVSNQLNQDIDDMNNNRNISLLAKWLPSVNASSKETVKKARRLARLLNMSEKQYRRTLSQLRGYLNIVEKNMSKKEYEKIDYQFVPAKAMNNYYQAFLRNDEYNFNNYIKKVTNGESKINASVLYPYDIVEKYFHNEGTINQVLEEQWNSLPNYINGENNFLIMADTSRSMYGRPLATSLGLAIYFAQRNSGAFKDCFMTFSNQPELVKLKGDSLFEILNYAKNASWNQNTDLQAAFDLLLTTAVNNNTDKKDMPSSIVVITDMEIDRCCKTDELFYQQTKDKYQSYGYDLPNIVFWNVNSRNNIYHGKANQYGIQLASGNSPIVFKSLINNEELTPYQHMNYVLNSDRYKNITI